MAETERVRLVLPLAPHAELLPAWAIEDLGRRVGFSRDTLEEVKLAVVEACLNALEYGGGNVQVEITGFTGARPRLEVVVEDGGPGFDPGTVPAPRLEAKLHAKRKRGWGLELIRHLMDDVVIRSRPGCTRIEMTRFQEGR